ncbi:hypothetical protein SAMN02910356_02168 [Selenomonas sp. GACV-9]|uniref:hypothetical protein n=1 Tax=Selenomonas sp. GACV-9 TaxID=3158782 RepID=UPI0008E6A307|nr:hypothetical protein SAMN02910356_02168 [Selenomonas ruminantium]
MKASMKKITALALAGMMSFGVTSVSLSSISEAHDSDVQQEEYADGTSNKYSHRIHEEETTHRQNVRSIRYEHRKGMIDDKEHDKKLKEEQERHDKKMQQIKDDYETHNHHKSR